MAEKREMYLECKNLKLGYGANVVVEDISFRVDKGDYLCIVGENGSGKSTLLKMISGIIEPDNGDIIYKGKSIIKDKILDLFSGFVSR